MSEEERERERENKEGLRWRNPRNSAIIDPSLPSSDFFFKNIKLENFAIMS